MGIVVMPRSRPEINPAPVRTATLHPDVLRAYIMHRGIVVSVFRPGVETPKIAHLDPSRLDEVLAKARREFGDGA